MDKEYLRRTFQRQDVKATADCNLWLRPIAIFLARQLKPSPEANTKWRALGSSEDGNLVEFARGLAPSEFIAEVQAVIAKERDQGS